MSANQMIMALIVLAGIFNISLIRWGVRQRRKAIKMRKVLDGLPRAQRKALTRYDRN